MKSKTKLLGKCGMIKLNLMDNEHVRWSAGASKPATGYNSNDDCDGHSMHSRASPARKDELMTMANVCANSAANTKITAYYRGPICVVILRVCVCVVCEHKRHENQVSQTGNLDIFTVLRMVCLSNGFRRHAARPRHENEMSQHLPNAETHKHRKYFLKYVQV